MKKYSGITIWTYLWPICLLLLLSSCEGDPLAPPQASFEFILDDEKREVIFENKSVNADSYSWDFGNGESSTSPSPTYIYKYSGSFRVWLYAGNGSLKDSTTKKIEIGGGVCPPFVLGNTCDFPKYIYADIEWKNEKIAEDNPGSAGTSRFHANQKRVQIRSSYMTLRDGNKEVKMSIVFAKRFNSDPNSSQIRDMFKTQTYNYSRISYEATNPVTYKLNSSSLDGIIIEITDGGRLYSTAFTGNSSSYFELTGIDRSQSLGYFEAKFSCSLKNKNGGVGSLEGTFAFELPE